MSNLLMIDIEGTSVSMDEQKILTHPLVGAVILFSHNFVNTEQLKNLVQQIKTIRSDLFIAVDHEGGNIQRFQRAGFRAIPSARVLGEAYDYSPDMGIQLARHYGETMAKDLLNVGVDLSLAPVLDRHGESEIIAHLDRAFHQAPEAVASLAEAFIEGMNNAGMPSVCKHFPGHGSCRADSHTMKPIDETPALHLRQTDLKPFKELISKQKVDAIMPAYVTYNAVDATHPAGFSKIWLGTILREEFGFTGLILSDCLSMKGADVGSLKTRAIKALDAGCDMLILCNQPRNRLQEFLENSPLIANKESAYRLQNFKQKMQNFKHN